MSKFIYILIALIYLRYCKCSDQTSCDFETDFCGYEHNEYFVRYTGKSPSVSSGPSFDHTYGDGWYGLCDGGRLRDPKEKCLLRKEVTIEADSKFDFWYYMFGFQLGTLELIANGEVVWSKTDRQQDGWLFAQVSLERGTYELLFSGNRSEAGRVSSDIAIDDLMLEGQILTTNIVTSPRTSAEPALDISDNFDSGVPTWTTEYTIAQWSVVNGNTSDFVGSYGPASDYSSLFSNVNLMTDEEGPSCEIPFSLESDPLKPLYFCQNLFLTIGTRRNYTLVCGGNPFAIPSPQSTFIRCNRGNYLMTTNERFDNPLGIFRSRLFSPVFTVPADVELFCFSFRYHIRSSDTDGFKVAIENYLNHEEVQTLSTLTGQSAIDRWYLASIEITTRYEQNRIFIEPIRGTNKEFASISIDSISVNYDLCEPEPTKTTATTTTSTTTTSTTTTSITTTTITETTSTPETETENTSHLISTSGNIDSTTTSEHPDESTLPSATSDHSDESTITSKSTTSTTTTTGVSSSTSRSSSSSTPRSSSTSRTTASTATTTTTIFREDEKKEDKDDTLAIVLGILIPVIVLSILGGAFYYFWKTGKIGKCGKDENANQDNESVKYVARTDFVDIHDNKNNELYPPIDEGSLKPGQK